MKNLKRIIKSIILLNVIENNTSIGLPRRKLLTCKQGHFSNENTQYWFELSISGVNTVGLNPRLPTKITYGFRIRRKSEVPL